MMVPSVLLLYFCTEILKLPLALGSLVILGPKAVIIALDPLIGRLSDGLRTPIGRRAPLMLVASVVSPLLFAVMFALRPTGDAHATFLMELGAYGLASAGYSLFGVPFMALPAELSLTQAGRARLTALRVAFVFLGMIIGAAAAPWLAARYGGGANGYRAMALTIAPALFAFMLVSGLSAARREAQPHAAGRDGASKVPVLKRLAFAPFAAPLLVNVCALTGMSAFMAASPYFVTYGLGWSAARTGAMVAAQLIAAFLSMAFWGRSLAARGVRANLWPALVLAASGAIVVAAFGHTGALAGVLVGSALFGAGVGGAQVSGQAGLAEAIRLAQAESRHAEGGGMTGLWTAGERIAYALGPAVASLTLSLGGFVVGARAQTASALEAARLSVAAGPVLVLAAGALLAFAHPAMRRLWTGPERA